jgi:hypothetical protein
MHGRVDASSSRLSELYLTAECITLLDAVSGIARLHLMARIVGSGQSTAIRLSHAGGDVRLRIMTISPVLTVAKRCFHDAQRMRYALQALA